jgi:uncharacterized protein
MHFLNLCLHCAALVTYLALCQPFMAVAGVNEGLDPVQRARVKAFREFKLDAERGNAVAHFEVGEAYLLGNEHLIGNVPADYQQARIWLRRSAEQCNADAQRSLGILYNEAKGLPKDEQQAYFWWLLASAQGDDQAQQGVEWLEQRITVSQRAAAQTAARGWKPVANGAVCRTPSAPSPITQAPNQTRPKVARPASTGTGFAIAGNRVVTNAHVVEGCERLTLAGNRTANLIATDRHSDLALIEVSGVSAVATLRAGRIRQGDAISVVGYPLAGLLASGAQVTTGNVSALAGLQNDLRFIQISAPVQPGNSGGPLLDAAGNVVGVVVSKLNAQKIAEVTGDIPQNVNFAISPLTLQKFLDSNGVEYQSAPFTRTLSTADVTVIAKRYTFLVECWK